MSILKPTRIPRVKTPSAAPIYTAAVVLIFVVDIVLEEPGNESVVENPSRAILEL